MTPQLAPATIRSGPDPIWSKSLVLGKHTDTTAGVLESEGGRADGGDVMRRSQAMGSDPAHSTSPFLRVRGSTRQTNTQPDFSRLPAERGGVAPQNLPTLNVAVEKKKRSRGGRQLCQAGRNPGGGLKAGTSVCWPQKGLDVVRLSASVRP